MVSLITFQYRQDIDVVVEAEERGLSSLKKRMGAQVESGP